MPHFGLMDEDDLGPIEGPLMRAKLHIRCGKRRLQQGKISLGILTLYDALISSMQWYIALPDHKVKFQVKEGENMKDDKTVFTVLNRSGVLDGKFDYKAFNNLVDEALKQELSSYVYTEILRGIESVMTQLGVMPFDEKDLPSEDPNTV
jgi:hypothetical protein